MMFEPSLDAFIITVAVAAACVGVTGVIARHSLRWAAIFTPLAVALPMVVGLLIGISHMLVDSYLPLWILLVTLPITLFSGIYVSIRTQKQIQRHQHELEEEQRLREIDNSRRDLITALSHDLRTPLAGIRAMAEALEDGVAPDPLEYYHRIGSEAQRTTSMVEDIMALARLSSSNFTLKREPVMVSDLVSDLLAQLQPLATRRGISLDGEATGPGDICADPALITRAVQNLVVNALNYSQPASRVLVTVESTAATVTISVRDECGGISPADCTHLFEVGWRSDAARTPGTAVGSGLGLPIVESIVRAHGGTVDVANAPADGTYENGCRFTITLPSIHPHHV